MPKIISVNPFTNSMEREILKSGERPYVLHQVLSAAAFQDKIQDFSDEFRDKLVCKLYAEEEGFEIDGDELQLAYDMFRYQKGIYTAEETLAWLSERGLKDEDLSTYLERNYWYLRFTSLLDEIREAYIPPTASFAMGLWPELILTGSLKSFATPFSWRVMASRKVSAEKELTDKVRSSFYQRIFSRLESVDAWLEQYFCSQEWLNEIIEMEACFIMVSREVLSPEHCLKVLQTKKLDFMRLVLQAAVFTSSDAAMEIYQCIVQDGEGFEAAMERVGAQTEDQTLLLEDASETLSPLLLSGVPGDILLTEGEEGEYMLYRVVKKVESGLEDPEVRARVESFLLSQRFDLLVEGGIRWLVPLE